MGWFSSSTEADSAKGSATVGTQTTASQAPASVLEASSTGGSQAGVDRSGQAMAGCPVAHDASPDAFRRFANEPSTPASASGTRTGPDSRATAAAQSDGPRAISQGDARGGDEPDRIGRIDPRNQMPTESQRRAKGQTVRLSTHRTTSTIPKGDDDPLPPRSSAAAGVDPGAGVGAGVGVEESGAMAGCPAHANAGTSATAAATAAFETEGQGSGAGAGATAAAAEKWEYPSPQQFFNAVLRKGFTNTRAEDVPSMVLIHNAVNERAWHEILAWEVKHLPERHPQRGVLSSASAAATAAGADAGAGASSAAKEAAAEAAMQALAQGECPQGIRLLSFKGDSSHITPKARLLSMMGYTKPFDTHFWTIDRCGNKVEYVIDFYKGKSTTSSSSPSHGASAGGGQRLLDMPSFYLDVRPAGVEGIPARLARAFGF